MAKAMGSYSQRYRGDNLQRKRALGEAFLGSALMDLPGAEVGEREKRQRGDRVVQAANEPTVQTLIEREGGASVLIGGKLNEKAIYSLRIAWGVKYLTHQSNLVSHKK